MYKGLRVITYIVLYLFSAFVGQATGKKGSSSIGTGKQTLRISSKGQAGKVEVVSIIITVKPVLSSHSKTDKAKS